MGCSGESHDVLQPSVGGTPGSGAAASTTTSSSPSGGMNVVGSGGATTTTLTRAVGGESGVGGAIGAGGSVSAGGLPGAGGKSLTTTQSSLGGATTVTSALPRGGSTASVGGSTSKGGTTGSGATSSGGSTASVGGGTAKGGTTGSGATSSGGTTSTTSSPPAVKVCAATGTLKQAAACNNKLIGAAIGQGSLSNSGYASAAGEFNYFTPENEMKWQTIEGSQGSFNYGPGDAIVNFANQRGGKIKGHTLVWHSQLASWVNSVSDVKSAMINHITNVMTHYKGKLHAWDVVNEAVDVDDKRTGMGNARLRDSVFKTKIGTDYIDIAFQTARKVDSSAKLFYNDFSTEGMNDKSDYVYKMVKSMKERGIPIDGVGIQTHIGTPNDSPTAAEVKENINRIAALGLEIQISELDINGCDGITDAAMATLYHDLVAACVQQPLCTAITVWGINDGGSWLNSFSEAGCNGKSARALLFTDSYQKKGTYTAVLNALTGN